MGTMRWRMTRKAFLSMDWMSRSMAPATARWLPSISMVAWEMPTERVAPLKVMPTPTMMRMRMEMETMSSMRVKARGDVGRGPCAVVRGRIWIVVMGNSFLFWLWASFFLFGDGGLVDVDQGAAAGAVGGRGPDD